MIEFVFVLGCPCSGKTTLVRELLGRRVYLAGDWTVGDRGRVGAGDYSGSLVRGGCDSLPRRPGYLARILSDTPPGARSVYCDGGTRDAIIEANRIGRTVAIVLDCSDAEANRRAAKRGSPALSGSYLDGERRKAQLLAKMFRRVESR